MSRDYLRRNIVKWQDGIPLDEYGHALDANELYDAEGNDTEDREKAVEAREVTNPYGSLHFAVGSGDDFYCFDYADLTDNRVAVHVTINSETGGFIQDMYYGILSKREAAYELRGWCDDAVTWTIDNRVRHSRKGWDQDHWYIVRHYLKYVMEAKPFVDYTERQLRHGRRNEGMPNIPFPCPKRKPPKAKRNRKWQVEVREWIGQSNSGVMFAGARRNSRGPWTTFRELNNLPDSLHSYLNLQLQPGAAGNVTLADINSLDFFNEWEGHHYREGNMVRFTCSVQE